MYNLAPTFWIAIRNENSSFYNPNQLTWFKLWSQFVLFFRPCIVHVLIDIYGTLGWCCVRLRSDCTDKLLVFGCISSIQVVFRIFQNQVFDGPFKYVF